MQTRPQIHTTAQAIALYLNGRLPWTETPPDSLMRKLQRFLAGGAPIRVIPITRQWTMETAREHNHFQDLLVIHDERATLVGVAWTRNNISARDCWWLTAPGTMASSLPRWELGENEALTHRKELERHRQELEQFTPDPLTSDLSRQPAEQLPFPLPIHEIQ